MPINPILHKHLTVNASQKRFYVFLALYLGLLSLFNLGLVGILVIPRLEAATVSLADFFTQGRIVFWGAGVLMLLTAALITPIAALTAFAGEHERRTWDLLRVTTLSTRTIVLGKLSSALSSGALYLFTPLPLLLTGYWLGDVSATALLITLGFVSVVLCAANVLALFLSARLKRTNWSVFTYYGFLLLLQPVSGFVASLYAFLRDRWMDSATPMPPHAFTETLVEHGWMMLASLHPLVAAISSVALAEEHGSWFLIRLSLERLPGVYVTLPLPWITSTVLLVVLALVCLYATIRAADRAER